MFLRVPFSFYSPTIHLILILNTVILIGLLIIVELVYAERPKAVRQHLYLFYPFVVVLVGLLIYAVRQQA
jgi:hypothetical protein